ncbi:MAG: hypothetical protein EXQ94_13080 [Alphaproteobacteria bacterium]|nr:hypothetical protein [Alphaproteobacteria bacterium]
MDAIIRRDLDRGVAAGVFRADVDPVRLYLSIAGMSYFHVANSHTLFTVFGRAFSRPDEREAYGRHCVDVIFGYLRP